MVLHTTDEIQEQDVEVGEPYKALMPRGLDIKHGTSSRRGEPWVESTWPVGATSDQTLHRLENKDFLLIMFFTLRDQHISDVSSSVVQLSQL